MTAVAQDIGSDSHPGSARASERAGRRNRCRSMLLGPIGALILISILSAALRLAGLGQVTDHIFDEVYYVDASRDIVGLHDPSTAEPGGVRNDPNPEHPAIAKLIIGGSIRLLGDSPAVERLPSVLFGSIAILLMYWMVRGAGGRPWMAVTASGLMASDILMLVHGRIATLDIFVVVFMLAAAGLYMRRRWAWAGVAIGVGMCTKLVAVDLLLAFALVEVGRQVIQRRFPDRERVTVREAAIRVGGCIAVAGAVYLVLLTCLDLGTNTYRNPLAHTAYMLQHLSVRSGVAAPGVHGAPSSAPWQWLYDRDPIGYLYQTVGATVLFDFRGIMSPPIAYAIVPSMIVAGWALRRAPDDTALLALAWFLATMLPFTAGAILGKATYIYYMVVVLPAVYLAIARCGSLRPRAPALLRAIFLVALVVSLVGLYPVRSLSELRPW